MKKITLSVFIILFFVTINKAQNTKPSLSITEVTLDENTLAAKSISEKLKSRLKKDFQITNESFLHLSADVVPGESRTINGIESYTISTSEIIYAIKGDNLPADKLSLEVEVKGTNEKQLYRKMGTHLIRDRKHIDALKEFISAYLEKHISSCDQVSTIINKYLSKKELAKANSMVGYYEWIGDCETQLSKSEQSIEEKHTQYACDLVIQKSSILVNSPDINDLNNAIDLLQMVPPDAPCAEEAIKVSTQISESALKLNKAESQKIADRVVLINSTNTTDWRSWYRGNYSRIYNR